MTSPPPPPPPEPTPLERRRDRAVFYPVAIVGGLFCMSIFIVIAADFGDPQKVNPVSNWVRGHANQILIFETALLVIIGLLAMFIDRVRTLRKIQQRQREAASSRDPLLPGAEHADRVG